ncbi:MAG: GDP-mannose 4,6-dehydratase [Methylobacter sp.]|nr:GDP-mannose 4,6-dehydratase [Methylobacter sp.]
MCGVSGQDGAYLARLLLDKGYEVWGSSRDAQVTGFSNLASIGIKSQVKLLSMAPNDFRSVLTALARSEPDEIYYLAGQSSVGLSFEQPTELWQARFKMRAVVRTMIEGTQMDPLLLKL